MDEALAMVGAFICRAFEAQRPMALIAHASLVLSPTEPN